MSVIVISGTRKLPLHRHCVKNFRDRAGWCIVETMTDEDGSNPRDYELTKQYPSADAAMQAYAKFVRAQTVEFEGEEDESSSATGKENT